jgi:subtilisin family serine protease
VIAAGASGEGAMPRAGEDSGDVVRAPGRDVLTLQPGHGYDYASGSSIAAAHVSGVAALLLAVDPRLDRAALRALLTPNGDSALNASASLDAWRQRHTASR